MGCRSQLKSLLSIVGEPESIPPPALRDGMAAFQSPGDRSFTRGKGVSTWRSCVGTGRLISPSVLSLPRNFLIWADSEATVTICFVENPALHSESLSTWSASGDLSENGRLIPVQTSRGFLPRSTLSTGW